MKTILILTLMILNLHSIGISEYKINLKKYIKTHNKISYKEFYQITNKYSNEDIKKCINKFSLKFNIPKKAYESIIHMENNKKLTYAINCNNRIRKYSSSIHKNYLNYVYCNSNNIDVGMMQINLKVWSREDKKLSFKTLLNPCYNIYYGMKILSKHKKETKNWVKTLGYYHSRTPKHFNNYVKGIRKYLNNNNK